MSPLTDQAKPKLSGLRGVVPALPPVALGPGLPPAPGWPPPPATPPIPPLLPAPPTPPASLPVVSPATERGTFAPPMDDSGAGHAGLESVFPATPVGLGCEESCRANSLQAVTRARNRTNARNMSRRSPHAPVSCSKCASSPKYSPPATRVSSTSAAILAYRSSHPSTPGSAVRDVPGPLSA